MLSPVYFGKWGKEGMITKGQTQSWWFFQADDSSKIGMNKFNFTNMIPHVELFSFVFWKKWKTQKNHFKINWPLLHPIGEGNIPMLQPHYLVAPLEFWTVLVEALDIETSLSSCIHIFKLITQYFSSHPFINPCFLATSVCMSFQECIKT